MNPVVIEALLAADFTIDPIENFFKTPFAGFQLNCRIAPLGQVQQTVAYLLSPQAVEKPDLLILWTLAEKQIPAFSALLYNYRFSWDRIAEEVRELAEYYKAAAGQVKTVLVPTWGLPANHRGLGVLDFKKNIGISNTLSRMNLLLSDLLSGCENIFLLDSQRYMATVPAAYDAKMWYMGKIPFSYNFFKHLAAEIQAALCAVYGKNKKVLVLDLDNTLWGGVLGEEGMTGVRLGGIDPYGEAFCDFQKRIMGLKQRGVLLALASKNNEDEALAALENHPEMILRKKDFCTWRINWQDKAVNIADIVSELNIGMDSVVFIDDNPAERERVSKALPEVFVPDWPDEPIHYAASLSSLTCFDSVHISTEDRERTNYYRDEKARLQLKANIPAIEDWLASLQMTMEFSIYSDLNKQRAVQLLNKTNQFNLCTRRFSQADYDRYAGEPDRRVILFNCSDRLGNYGSVGLTSFQFNDYLVVVEDFLLSCRILGRKIENAMFYVIAEYARRYSKKVIKAQYIPTPGNSVCATFLNEIGMVKKDGNFFHENPADITRPEFIKIFEVSNHENKREKIRLE